MSDHPDRDTARSDSRLRTLAISSWWWLVTLVTLVVLDDLLTGPIFWVLSQFAPWLSITIAFVAYWTGQVLIVRSMTNESPNRAALFVVDRLNLSRRKEIDDRFTVLQRGVTGPVLAVPLSLVVGGVLPPLLLHRLGSSTRLVRRLSLVTAAVYASEFAFLHAYLPSVVR